MVKANHVSGDQRTAEFLMRRVWLDGPLAAPIFRKDFTTGFASEMEADWAGIGRVESPRCVSFNLYLVTRQGRILACYQFETLRIAIDQGWEITGIAPARWKRCAIPVGQGDEDELPPWNGE